MKSGMSNSERLIAALLGKEVDRLPWSPLIDGYFVSSLAEQGKAMDILACMKYLEIDFMERHVSGTRTSFENGVEQASFRVGDEFVRQYKTKYGDLEERQRITGNTSVVTKHFIEKYEDIKLFQHVAESARYEADIDAFVQRDQEIGDYGIATLSGPMSPIQELLQFVCGVENTVYFTADYEDEMDELMEAIHARNIRMYNELVKVPAKVIFDYEDTSTTVMNKTMFVERSTPKIQDYNRIVQDSGKVFITHMCGKLRGFAELIGNLDVNGIDSVCPPSTGDLYVWDARAVWGKKKVIIGGIEPPSLCFMDVAQTLDTVGEIMTNLHDKQGFILSTGDAVPYGTPIENLLSISKLIQHMGAASLDAKLNVAAFNEAKDFVLQK